MSRARAPRRADLATGSFACPLAEPAPSKESFSNFSCPILACSALRSIGGVSGKDHRPDRRVSNRIIGLKDSLGKLLLRWLRRSAHG